MTNPTVLVLVGSLRADSLNRRLTRAVVAAAPHGVTADVYEGLREVPHYDQDLDSPNTRPSSAQALLDAVAAADALVAVTPEYNGSTSSVLKNALDWASRRLGPAHWPASRWRW